MAWLVTPKHNGPGFRGIGLYRSSRGVRGFGGVQPEQVTAFRTACKNARLYAAAGQEALARQFFSEAQALWEQYTAELSPYSDEYMWAKEAVYGTPAEQAAANADTKTNQALVDTGRINSRPSQNTSVWSNVDGNDFKPKNLVLNLPEIPTWAKIGAGVGIGLVIVKILK